MDIASAREPDRRGARRAAPRSRSRSCGRPGSSSRPASSRTTARSPRPGGRSPACSRCSTSDAIGRAAPRRAPEDLRMTVVNQNQTDRPDGRQAQDQGRARRQRQDGQDDRRVHRAPGAPPALQARHPPDEQVQGARRAQRGAHRRHRAHRGVAAAVGDEALAPRRDRGARRRARPDARPWSARRPRPPRRSTAQRIPAAIARLTTRPPRPTRRRGRGSRRWGCCVIQQQTRLKVRRQHGRPHDRGASGSWAARRRPRPASVT